MQELRSVVTLMMMTRTWGGSALNNLQTNKQKIETVKPETDRRRRRREDVRQDKAIRVLTIGHSAEPAWAGSKKVWCHYRLHSQTGAGGRPVTGYICKGHVAMRTNTEYFLHYEGDQAGCINGLELGVGGMKK